MAETNTVLLIEDEPQIRRFVRTALESEGCGVLEAANGASGLAEAGARKPELVVVDLGLPDMDGVEVVRGLRSWSTTPILILSARSDEHDKVTALDAGADDYLSKPFGVAELLARVRALLRRRLRATEASPRIALGEVEIDFSRRSVTRLGESIHLTPTEYRLLGVLVANAGKVLTHRYLIREVWGSGNVERSHYLRIYVSRLRQKLETDPAQPTHFLTETAVGYRLEL